MAVKTNWIDSLLDKDLHGKSRGKVTHARNCGRIYRQACEVCGEPKGFAHHEDYSRPYDVRWLCYSHHSYRHVELDIIKSLYDLHSKLTKHVANYDHDMPRLTSDKIDLIAELTTIDKAIANIIANGCCLDK